MNSTWNKIKSQTGITYIELLVALILSSIVVIFIISANLFVNKFIRTWERNNAIYEEGEYILSTIDKDLGNCDELSSQDSTKYDITKNNGDTITYFLSDGKLLRDDRVLNTVDIVCEWLSLSTNQFEISTPDSILIDGKTVYKEELVTIEFQLEYSGLMETFKSNVRLGNDSHIY